MEKILPTALNSEKQLLSLIRRSMMICDPHAAIQHKSSFNHAKYRMAVMTQKQAA
jgi:hypothetical protein